MTENKLLKNTLKAALIVAISAVIVPQAALALDINSSQSLQYYSGGILNFEVGTNAYTTMYNNLSMNGYPIENIGVSGTDFTPTGGLSLADMLTISNGGLNVNSGGMTVSGAVNLDSGEIDNAELANSSLTISSGTGLTGGGTISLGGSTTIGHVDTSTQSDVDTTGGTIIDSVTLDGMGHVTGMGTRDIDSRYVELAGDTMTGNLSMGGYNINSVADPSQDMDAANKQWVRAELSGSGEQDLEDVLSNGNQSNNYAIDMTGFPIYNIGDYGTDFTSTGGLVLADDLDMGSNYIADLSNLYSDDSNTNFFSGGCGDNSHITGISSSGSVSCGSDSGDISSVSAGNDIDVSGGTSGDATVSLESDIDINYVTWANQEQPTGSSGQVYFDENYYADYSALTGGNGGGLAVYNEDGWGAIYTTANDQWISPTFDGMDLNGNLNMGTYRIENLGTPDSGDDAMDRDYADSRYINYGWDLLTDATKRDDITDNEDVGFDSGTGVTVSWDGSRDVGFSFDCSDVQGNEITCSGETIGVDEGSGNGLDADLLDGEHASAFMDAGTDNWVNEGGDTMSGNLDMNGNNITYSGNEGDIIDVDRIRGYNDIRMSVTDGSQGLYVENIGTGSEIFKVGSDGTITAHGDINSAGSIDFGSSATTIDTTTTGTSSSALYIGDQQITTENIDTDTHLSENDVETYIFDTGDNNQGNLGLNGNEIVDTTGSITLGGGNADIPDGYLSVNGVSGSASGDGSAGIGAPTVYTNMVEAQTEKGGSSTYIELGSGGYHGSVGSDDIGFVTQGEVQAMINDVGNLDMLGNSIVDSNDNEVHVNDDFRVGNTLYVDGGTECGTNQYIGGDGSCHDDQTGADGYIGDSQTHTAGGLLNMSGYNIKMDGGYISNDGDDEGIRIYDDGSVGLGEGTTASGLQSTAMGGSTTASGERSTAMGYITTASGMRSTAMGYYTNASGDHSTAMGYITTASGVVSTAIGSKIIAQGDYSFGIGLDTTSRTISQSNTMAVMGGDVGIGTTAPSSKLDIEGGNLNMSGNNIIMHGGWLSGDGNNEGVYVANDGDVGIGTSSPGGYKLKVVSTQDGIYSEVDDAIETAVKGYNSQMDVTGYLGYVSGVMGISDASTGLSGYFAGGKFYVNSSVGIGTQEPDSALDLEKGNLDMSGNDITNVGDITPNGAIRIGTSLSTNDIEDVAIGRQADASGTYYETAVGYQADASGAYGVALGSRAGSTGMDSTSVGAWSSATGTLASVFGYEADASGNYGSAIGSQSNASAIYSSAFGYDSKATAEGAIAIGRASLADESYTVELGSSSQGYDLNVHGAASLSGNLDMNENNITGVRTLHLWGPGTNGAGSALYFGDQLTSTNPYIKEYGSSDSDQLVIQAKSDLFLNPSTGDVGIGTTSPSSTLDIAGSLEKETGSFDIEHPNPEMAEEGYRLRHSFVESPTRGDNLYRYTVNVSGGKTTMELPDYFQHLNENPQIWVSPVDHFGRAYGKVTGNLTELEVHADTDGEYNVLLIGTRKDEAAKEFFDEKGVVYKEDE